MYRAEERSERGIFLESAVVDRTEIALLSLGGGEQGAIKPLLFRFISDDQPRGDELFSAIFPTSTSFLPHSSAIPVAVFPA